MPGPLQVIAVSFGPGSDFQGRVLAEVDRLQGRGVLRLLDLLFVSKSEDGTIQRTVIGDDDFGALLSRIVPFGGAGLVQPARAGSSGFDPTDARALAHSLLPGTALAFLLIEHGWAQPLFDVIAETGGELLGEGFLTAEARLIVGAEVAAMEGAVEVIAAAQAAEARATLLAIAAETRAADAIAASQATRAAAAADAVRALISAGIVEEAAAHEAVEALSAAGLLIAAADEATAEAVAQDVAKVMVADQAAADAVAEDKAAVVAADKAAAAAVAEDEAAVAAVDEAAAEALAEDEAAVAAANETVAEDEAAVAVANEAVAEGEAAVAAANEVAAQAVADAAATVSAASISVAEARVLRYLPTPLTFALIADKLGISRSAAKDRAGRIYQKLGVHSRAEAVTRARALGLID
jgi:DNA-binding CsgD family transcriptional regulator